MSCTGRVSNNYQTLEKTWTLPSREKYFVSYAVRGPMVVASYGLRQDMPVDHPITGPVSEPSPLNNQWQYSPKCSSCRP